LADIPELEGYFSGPATLNLFLMALVCRKMDTGKTIARSVSSFYDEIEPHFILRLKE